MRRKLLLFGLQFLPAFVLCALAYPRVLPAYQSVVVQGASAVLRRLEPPLRLETTADGGWRALRIHEDGSASFYWSRPGAYLHLTLLGLALLPALLLATPVPPARRLLLTLAGLALLLVCHVAAAIALVRAVHGLEADPASAVCKWLRTTVNVYGQLISFALWGLLTWSVWLPRPDEQGRPER